MRKLNSTFQEFKAFIANDNIIELATAVIFGGAITAMVDSLVNDIFMPLIVALTGQQDVTHLVINVGSTTLAIGNFIQAIINFLLIALFLFVVIKSLTAVKKQFSTDVEDAEDEPNDTELLQEILEELRESNKYK